MAENVQAAHDAKTTATLSDEQVELGRKQTSHPTSTLDRAQSAKLLPPETNKPQQPESVATTLVGTVGIPCARLLKFTLPPVLVSAA